MNEANMTMADREDSIMALEELSIRKYRGVSGILKVGTRILVAAMLIIPGSAYADFGITARPMKQRAEEVTSLKNSFVRLVLEHEGIAYEADRTGLPVRIFLNNSWENVHQIEIVPMTAPGAMETQVGGHGLFIYTDKEIYRIDSNLPIRKEGPQ